MNVQEALRILKPDDNTMEGLKRAYRAAARKYHPDINSHGAELMKLVNQAYELLFNYGTWGPESTQGTFGEDFHKFKMKYKDEPSSLDEEIRSILDQVGHLPGLFFEVCGSWLWVTGDTYPYRKQLKAAGLRFAKKKQAWFWRPEDSKSHNKGEWSLEEIRGHHGSVAVATDQARHMIS